MPQTRSRRGGGGIYYDKAKRLYRAQVRVDGKRRTVATAPERDEATRALNAYLAGERPSSTPASGPATTVGDRVEWWRDVILPTRRPHGRPLAPGTIMNYRRTADQLVEGLGAIPLGELTTEHVERYLRSRVGDLSEKSLRFLLMVLNQVLDECVWREHVRRNVARRAGIPAEARPARPRRALDEHECTRLLVALRGHRYEHLYALALSTGARRNELIGLPWSAVDLDAGTMTIGQALRRRDHTRWEIAGTKSGNVRTVRLGETAIAHLRARLAEQRREQLAARSWSNAGGLVFTRSTGAPLDPRNVDLQWRKLADSIGLDGVVLHELRHTVGSHAVDAGVPLAVIADQLGHGSIDQLARTYRHAVRPVVEGVGGIMDAFAPSEASPQ